MDILQGSKAYLVACRPKIMITLGRVNVSLRWSQRVVSDNFSESKLRPLYL